MNSYFTNKATIHLTKQHSNKIISFIFGILLCTLSYCESLKIFKKKKKTFFDIIARVIFERMSKIFLNLAIS